MYMHSTNKVYNIYIFFIQLHSSSQGDLLTWLANEMLKTFLNNKASMLKSSVICIHAHRRCLSYFSSAFNNLANQGPQNVPSQRINNLDLDVFVNQDHKQMDLLDKLIKLR